MPATGLLDEKNAALWQYLHERFQIEIRRENRGDYLLLSKGGETIISVPNDKAEPAAFTHELLHVALKNNEIYIGSDLTMMVEKNEVLSKFYSRKLLDHTANCLEHMKMFPLFISMGYPAETFDADYQQPKLTNKDLQQIKEHFRSRIFFKFYYHRIGIEYFIEKYFAARACPNPEFDYSKQLQQLKKTAPILYGILDRFTTSWMSFDERTMNHVTNSYRPFVNDFVTELEHWAKGKTII